MKRIIVGVTLTVLAVGFLPVVAGASGGNWVNDFNAQDGYIVARNGAGLATSYSIQANLVCITTPCTPTGGNFNLNLTTYTPTKTPTDPCELDATGTFTISSSTSTSAGSVKSLWKNGVLEGSGKVTAGVDAGKRLTFHFSIANACLSSTGNQGGVNIW